MLLGGKVSFHLPILSLPLWNELMVFPGEYRPQRVIPQSSIRGVSLAGLVLLGLYASIVAGSLFPIQLLTADWQLKVGTTLINISPLALIGLMTLHLTAALEPKDPVLIFRRSIASKLAVLASIGFMLLVPLLSVAFLSQQQQQSSDQVSLIRRADSNLKAMRQVVANASNTKELHDQLMALNGPVLNDADRRLPLPIIKSQVSNVLDQAAAQISQKKQQLPPSNPLRLLPSLLRNAVSSFFLAIGFSGLSRRPGKNISLLLELQDSWQLFCSHCSRSIKRILSSPRRSRLSRADWRSGGSKGR